MFAKSTIAAVALFASYVAAQGSTANTTIDPSTVSDTDKSQWCASEITVCGDLCSGDYEANTCDTTSLNYTCTCNNGSAPGLQYYQGSLDWFICERIYANCIAAGQNDAAAQKLCTTNRDNNCGTLNPNNFTQATTSSSSSSSSASATATAASTASSTASTSTSKAAAATMMALGREYGSGVVAVGVAAAFGLML